MPQQDAPRWGFCWLPGTISEQTCYHCEISGVILLVEIEAGTLVNPRVTLLCEEHKEEHRRLWQAYFPEGEMSAAEAERLAR
jgi:hypothetical protein